MNDVLSAMELAHMMVEKSTSIDEALTEYRGASEAWNEAQNESRLRQAQAYAFVKGKTVGETRALIDIECDREISEAQRLEVLRSSASKALDARRSQLSALQSLAAALREELRLARAGPEMAA